MNNFSVRLTDKQVENIKKLADSETKNMNHILRDLIDIGLQQKGIMSGESHHVHGVPAYEIISTRASLEVLMLLRKMAEKTSPELIDIAQQLASERVEEYDLTEIINV